MNKKRYVLFECANQEHLIRDTKIEKFLNMFEINEQLNKQQTIINKLKEDNEQLRTRLLICQQSKNDDGRFQVWEVPPIKIGTRITTSTTFNGDEDEI